MISIFQDKASVVQPKPPSVTQLHSTQSKCMCVGGLLHCPFEGHRMWMFFVYITVFAFELRRVHMTWIHRHNGACIRLCLWWASPLHCQPAVVYEVLLTVETIRPVKGSVCCLLLFPTAHLNFQLMVEIKRLLLRGILRQDLGRYLRNLNEWKACKVPI